MPGAASEIEIRAMTTGDLPAADALRDLAGWNQTLDDWRRFLALEPDGCFVAVDGNRIVGAVTSICHGEALAWIGMMLVHPERRSQGIGSRLMRRALDYLRARRIPTIKLDATPLGLPLYEKLGFVAESALARWERRAGGADDSAALGAAELREAGADDWPRIESEDARVFGAPRGRLLRALADAAKPLLLLETGGRLRGWGMLRAGARADYLGPVVCLDPPAASVLAQGLLARRGNRPVFWDVMEANEAAKKLAKSLGFMPARPLTRMRLGPPTDYDAKAAYGIADPALG